MDLQLKGKKILVTGSTAGIGFATARALAAESAAVIINGRGQVRVDAAIQKIRKLHPNANLTGVASDVSNAEGCKNLVKAVEQVDILVNNMGIFDPKPFEKIPDEDWMHFFEANVMSGVRLSRHYLSGMREKNWGRILFVSSESAVQIPAEMIHYGMTKTAQIAVARGIAETVGGRELQSTACWPVRRAPKASKLLFREWEPAATLLPSSRNSSRPCDPHLS
jgi:NAD(P)-dependent dehydrogenase (short-subunit alcohol dehydrogenase family)